MAVTFEGYERRVEKINKCLAENGIASLVAQGFGIALVADVDAIHRDDICIRHLVSHESFSHTVYMGYMTGKYQLPAIKRFIEFVRESCS